MAIRTQKLGSWGRLASDVRLLGSEHGASVASATFARARAALDIAESYHASVRRLDEAESEKPDAAFLTASRTALACSAADAMSLVCPFDTFSNHAVDEYGLTQLVREIAESFWNQVEAHSPGEEDEDPDERGKAAAAALSLPAPRVDRATKARARKVHSLWKRDDNGAAKERLENMASQRDMPFDTFLAACGLTP